MSTTVGTSADGGRWVAVCLLELDAEHLLVEEREAQPDDRDAEGLIVRRYQEGEWGLAQGAARVLALGGQLGTEPEQLAASPVRGQALADVRPAPRIGAWLELDGRDSRQREQPRAKRMFARSSGATCT
jgi:hypothetical protein